MSVLRIIRERFADVLLDVVDDPADRASMVDMVRPSQDPKFGDYQANFAMSLGKRLGRSPRQVAEAIVSRLTIDDLCHPPEVAGPGFINLRLRETWLAEQLRAASQDSRLGIMPSRQPKTYILDYSAPNVAKPMHVGHIRSTVIGDALYRTLTFLGHRVISDNHLGDWGTQFGMILYGYKNFLDRVAYERQPVAELSRLYRVVAQLVDYQESREARPAAIERIEERRRTRDLAVAAAVQADAATQKQAAKERKRLDQAVKDAERDLAALDAKLATVEADADLDAKARDHADIGRRVLAETAALHEGDAENLRLWHEFLPHCLREIERIYERLGVRFDETLGESFYHDRLHGVVADLQARGIARESEGAICAFLPGYSAPMIVAKQDGAFLYATTDLATLAYRLERWKPDAILYVVDHRQSLHFEQLFAVARLWSHPGMDFSRVELCHVQFGTVLGDDGRPFKTRSGDTVGLEGLLDEAVRRARAIIEESQDSKASTLDPATQDRIAETVGIAALKYADLSQNRTSDYVFSYDKMLAMTGNTATYMQYAYARVQSIFEKGNVDRAALAADGGAIVLEASAERALAVELLRLGEAIEQVVADYRPNQLTAYLFELANRYSTFFEECPVLRAPNEEIRRSRLALCDLTARTIRQGLELLGIAVVERM